MIDTVALGARVGTLRRSAGIARPSRRVLVDTLVQVESPATVALFGFAVVLAIRSLPLLTWEVGRDYDVMVGAARGWLNGQPFYPAIELAGPFEIWHQAILYPPTVLALLVPFTVLPAILWWALPLAVIGVVVAWHRPSRLGLAAIAVAAAFPNTVSLVTAGNITMWAVAGLALGTVKQWPAVFVAIKPSLAFLALFGFRHGSWRVAAAAFVTMSAVGLALMPEYLTVALNARHDRGLLYSIGDVPFALIPIVAFLTRRSRNPVAEPELDASASAR